MAIDLGTAIVKFASDTTGLEAGFQKANALVAGVALGVGVAAVAVGVAAVKMAGQFQAGVTTLVTGAGESKKNIDLISSGLLNMATVTGTSTKQLTDGMFMIESAGYRGADGLKVLQAAAEGAKVGNADLGVTANAVTTVMKDYGMGANQAGDAMNFLTAIVQNGKTTLSALAPSMASILPTASALKVRLVDVGAAMTTVRGEGMPAANAATYLRRMLMNLAAPSAGASKALADIGLSAQQVSDGMKKSLPDTLQLIMTRLAETYKVGSPQYVEALKAISGGTKTMQGMLDLTGTHLKDFQNNVLGVSNTMQQGKGSIVGWSEVQGDFNFKMDQAKAAAEAFMITLGTMLLPVVTRIVGAIAPAIGAFTAWIQSGDNLKNALSNLIPVFAGVAAIIGIALVSAVVSFVTALSPVVFIVLGVGAAVAGLTAIFRHFYDTNAGFRSFIDGLVSSFKNLSGVFSTAKGIFDTVVGVVKNIASAFQTVFVPVQQVQQAVKPLTDTFDRATGVIKNVLTVFKPLTDTFDRASGAIHPVVSATKSMSDTFDRATGIIASTTSVVNPFVAVFVNIKNAFIAATPVFTMIWNLIKILGTTIATSFKPVWDQLVTVWNGQILPALKQLWTALQPLLPILKTIGEIILGVVVVALGIMFASLIATVKGLAGFLAGMAQVVGGIIQAFSGVVQIISGIVRFIYDLFTGNFSKLGADLGAIWQGVVTMFTGVLNIIKGLFSAAWGFISGVVSGFVQGIIGFFTNLWHALVGGSIVPDMINGIVSWFAGLPGKVFAFVSSLVSGVLSWFTQMATQVIIKVTGMVSGVLSWFATLLIRVVSAVSALEGQVLSWFTQMATNAIIRAAGLVSSVVSYFAQLPGRVMGAISGLAGMIGGFFSGLASAAFSWGMNIVNSIANGIRNTISAVVSAAQAVASAVANFLPHSPAREGPLRDLILSGSLIPQQVAEGMARSMPKVQASMNLLLAPVSSSLPAGHASSFFATMAASQGPPIVHNHFYVDGQELATTVMSRADAMQRARYGTRSRAS